MDNPENLATLGTQDTGRRQTNQKHTTIGKQGQKYSTQWNGKKWKYLTLGMISRYFLNSVERQTNSVLFNPFNEV